MNQRRTRPGQVRRAIEGLSLAALGALARNGPAGARKVVGETLLAAHGREDRARLVEHWDVVRGFPLDEAACVAVLGGGYNDGTTDPLERYLIAHLLRHFGPRRLLEVGTFRGATTRLLLENIPADARVWTMDLPLDDADRDYASLTAPSDARLVRQRVVGADYRSHPRAADVTQVFGDTFDPATWAGVPEGVDFLFIDASHSYDAVKNDTERARPKLAPGAVVLWHDYTLGVSPERGVGRYLRELMARDAGVFVVETTSLGVSVPVDRLKEARRRVPDFFDAETFALKRPAGAFPWLAD